MTKPNHELSPALIVLMSIATGLAVASNYYAQPLLDTIARNFSLSASSAGFIVTAAQLGYAAGLLFLVPLGDMFERRRLIVSMTLLAAGGMLITASSQSLAMMILGTALTGLFSVVAQILVPLAATLASPDKRGKVVGLDMGTGSAFSLLPAQNATGNWIKVVQRLPVRIELDQKQLEQYPLRIGLSTLVSVNTTNRDGQVLANKVRSTPVAVSTAREISLAPVNKLIDDIVKANAG